MESVRASSAILIVARFGAVKGGRPSSTWNVNILLEPLSKISFPPFEVGLRMKPLGQRNHKEVFHSRGNGKLKIVCTFVQGYLIHSCKYVLLFTSVATDITFDSLGHDNLQEADNAQCPVDLTLKSWIFQCIISILKLYKQSIAV